MQKKTDGIGLLGRMVSVFSLLTVVFSIFTAFNGYSRYLELFSHFRLQYLWASLVCLIALVILKHYKSSIIMVSCLALNAMLVVPWYLEAGTVSAGTRVQGLKIIHSNVLTPNTSYQKVIDMVSKEKPDVLVLQEVDARWIAALKDIRKALPYYSEHPREDNFGIAVYSKYPLQNTEVLSLGPANIPSIKATLRYGNKVLTLVTSHPLPPIDSGSFQYRNEQIIEIAKLVKKISTPLVLIGDLNITMWSRNYDPLVTGTALGNARKGFGVIPTWPASYPLIPIDQCLVSANVKVSDIRSGPDVGSDHLPLIVNLLLGEQ